MSTPDFSPNGSLPSFDPSDWLPMDKKQVNDMTLLVDNAVRLDGTRITISREAAWLMRDVEVRVGASKDFSINGDGNLSSEFNVLLMPEREDDTDYSPPEHFIKSSYSSAEGLQLDINGDTDYDDRCVAEMCLFAGQIARAGIFGQANPASLRSPAVRDQLNLQYGTILRILSSDPGEAFDIVNGFNTPIHVRSEAIKKMPFDILDLLKKTRLGALFVHRRVHLGIDIEGDTTLSIVTSISHLENGQDNQCNYRRISTPSGRTYPEEFCESVSYLTVIDDTPQSLIVTEETYTDAPNDTEPIRESASLSSREAAVEPITEVITRKALYGDFRRLHPELLILHDKYGI